MLFGPSSNTMVVMLHSQRLLKNKKVQCLHTMGSQNRALCTSLHFIRLLKCKWSWRDGHLERLECLLSNPKQCSSEPSTHITNQVTHRCLILQFRDGRRQENQGGLLAFNLAKKTPTLGSGSDYLKGLDGKYRGKHQTPSSLSLVQVMRKNVL